MNTQNVDMNTEVPRYPDRQNGKSSDKKRENKNELCDKITTHTSDLIHLIFPEARPFNPFCFFFLYYWSPYLVIRIIYIYIYMYYTSRNPLARTILMFDFPI